VIPADKQHAGLFRTRDPELDSGSLSGAKSFCDEVLSQIREILNQVQDDNEIGRDCVGRD